MNIKENSIWPNGIKKDNEKISKFYPLGENKIDISSIVWPKGDKIVTSMVYDNNKLVGYCDTKSMTTHGTNNIINLPYKHIDIDFSSIVEGTLTVESPNAIVKNIKWCDDINNSVPAGYLRLDFIESTGTQRIHTGKNATDQTCVEVEFGDVINKSWAPLVSTNGGSYSIFAKGSQHVTYNVPRFDYYNSIKVFPSYDVSNGKHTMRKEAHRNFIDNEEVTPNDVAPTSVWAELLLLHFPYLISYNQCKLYKYKKWELGQDIQQYFVPALDSSGKPCMYDLVERKQFNNAMGVEDFIAGFNMLQAERLGTFIPNNKTLSISLPWEANMIQYNSGVEASLKQAKEKNCTLAIRYRSHEECPEIYNKYAECETLEDMIKVNPNYKTDLSNDGEWLYPLPKLRDAEMAFKDSPMRKFCVTLPSLENGKQFFCGTALEGEMTIDLPSISIYGSSQMFVTTTSNERKLTKLTINAKPGSAVHQIVNAWTVSDHYLEELNLTGFTAPWYNGDAVAARHYALKRFRIDAVGCVTHWSGAFPHSILDKESILTIVRATIIPADPSVVSSNITSHIGIHVDYKTDEEVLAAISTLEAGGHKLSIRWNGTPTSGVSLMDLEEIWCKVVEKEDGEYVNENGIRCDIDWGHYVTDTSEYKLFFSLVEAEEYYKLRKAI